MDEPCGRWDPGYSVARGNRSNSWDTRDAAGNPMPDGQYTVRFVGTDPAGASSVGSASVVIDTSPPAVTSGSGTLLSPRQALVLNATDAGTIESMSATFAGVTRSNEYGGGLHDTLSVLPTGGWVPGSSNSVQVTTRDALGNEGVVTITFRVSGGAIPNRITAAGLAGVKPGMTIQQVEDAWGVKLSVSYPNDRSCGTAAFTRGPVRGYVIIQNGRFSAVFISKGAATDRGIKIGSTRAAIGKTYKKFRVARAPYSGGVDYYVKLASGTVLRIETNRRKKVTGLDYGNKAAGYAEGCV